MAKGYVEVLFYLGIALCVLSTVVVREVRTLWRLIAVFQ